MSKEEDVGQPTSRWFAPHAEWLMLGVALGFGGLMFPLILLLVPLLILLLACEGTTEGWWVAVRKLLRLLTGALIGYAGLCLISPFLLM